MKGGGFFPRLSLSTPVNWNRPMTPTRLALMIACGVASCSGSEAPYHPLNDVYVVDAFFDAGSEAPVADIGPAIVTLADPMIYIASSDGVVAGPLLATPEGWTMREARPQCTVNCPAGKDRLQAMLRDGAIMTFDEDGTLLVQSPEGRRATGAPAPAPRVE